MEPKLDSKLTLHPFEEITHYNIHLNLNTNANLNSNSSRDLIIVLDRSGSMHNYISAIKTALINLINNVSSPKIFSTASFISFESSPNVFLKKNPEELKNIINKMTPCGGTNFSKVLNAIAESIPQLGEKIEFLQIIFLTDGEIQEAHDRLNDYKNFNEGISNLSSSLKNHTFCFEIHTMGMGKNHDPFILDSLIKLGEGKGTYQFLASNDEIDIAFDNILKELLNKNKIFDVSLCSHSLLYTPINLRFKTGDQRNYEANGFIFAPFLKLQNDDLYLEMRIQDGKEQIYPHIEKSKEVEKFDAVLWMFELIKQQLEGISDKLMNLSKLKVKQIDKYEIIAKELSDIKIKLHSAFRKVFRFSLEQRQILLNNATPLHDEYIPNIEKLLNAGFANQINNELLANVQALSHRDKFSSKIKRLVDRRAQTVAKLINEEAELVKKYVDQMDKSTLMQKYQGLLANTGCCIFTTNNFIEALFEHDCLCITFLVTCDESCMVNSKNLRIHKIFSSMITANSFLESVKFKLKIKPKAIGGFMHDENEKGGVIKGEAAEEINACLPIFLCPEHWEISQILMKPILGWVMTLDPLGFSFDQIKTVPFLVLIKCMEDLELNPEKEFQKRVFQNVFETCKNIMHLKMESKILKEEVIEKFLTYFFEDRRVNEISNNNVFLLHLLCCVDIGFITKEDLVYFNDFFNKVCEEEMRRSQESLMEKELNLFLQQILNISDDLIQKFGNQKMKELKEQKELLLIENKNNLPEESKQVDLTGKFIDESSRMTPKIDEILNGGNLSEFQKQYLEAQYLSFKMTTQRLFKIKNLIDKKHDPIEFNNIGIEQPAQMLCFSIQNLIQAKNSNRASALKNSFYKNAEKIEEAIDFLEGLAFKVLCEESNKLTKWKNFEYNEIKKNKSPIILPQYEVLISFSTMDHSQFEKISVTYDLCEAALILEQLKIPRRHIIDGLFLHLKESVKLIEKIELIMLGTHNGKVFRTDWLKQFLLKPRIIDMFIKAKKIVYADLLEVIEKKKAQRKNINTKKSIYDVN